MSDVLFMSRALELARLAPFTSPNPRVGAVLVRDGSVLAEGWHMGPGTPHAEALALEEADAEAATLYVNLEPCSHQGRTPPCAPAVADAGVGRVVVSVLDPDERVRGAGVEHLRDCGVTVDVGLMAAEATWLNAPYLHHRTTGRAFLSLKLASTLDGRLSAPDGTSRWITGDKAREVVHRRRLEADAVVVGAGTVLTDDPALSVRAVDAPRQPTALVVDGSGRVGSGARVFKSEHVVVATTVSSPHERQLEWKDAGADVWVLPGDGTVDLGALLSEAGRRGFVELLCEGGAELATSLLRADLVDRLEFHYGAKLVGSGGAQIGDLGVTTMDAARCFELVESHDLDGDLVAIYRRTA